MITRLIDAYHAWRVRRAIARLTPEERRRLTYMLQKAIGECERLLGP